MARLHRCCYGFILLYVSLVLAVSAQATDEQITVNLFPENQSGTGNPVKLTFKGKTYPMNGWFDQMVTAGTAAPDEKFVIDALAVNKSGTVANVRSLWMPNEQDEVSELYKDPQVYASSQAYFKRITGAAFLGKILYGNYEIFIVQNEVEGYGSRVRAYTVKNVNGRFYFTNSLKGDPVFLYLSTKYASALPVKRR